MIITSVRVVRSPGHDRVQVWNRGGLAGELIVTSGDGDAFAALLIPNAYVHDSDGETMREWRPLAAVEETT